MIDHEIPYYCQVNTGDDQSKASWYTQNSTNIGQLFPVWENDGIAVNSLVEPTRHEDLPGAIQANIDLLRLHVTLANELIAEMNKSLDEIQGNSIPWD
jgi:hypothetical protein